ncbi:hypothetical protein X011_00575 [Mycobacterium tuberculosis variant microti OV254]|nr:hypothetical protein X011_00575 [Mycobacterium tuberculosis variant microti OV254]
MGLHGDGQSCRAHQIHEQCRDIAIDPAELDPVTRAGELLRPAGHLTADVAAEQVAQSLPFPQPGRHRVEAGLQQSQLGSVENGHENHAGHGPHRPVEDGHSPRYGQDDAPCGGIARTRRQAHP